MREANFQEEKKLRKRGFRFVAGLDEAGRGPLAGPVVAAVVAIKSKSDFPRFTNFWKSDFQNIKDSKKLSARQREIFYKLITRNKNIRWGIGIVSEKVIDRINILEATKSAMIKALKNLKTDFLILDGNMKLNLKIPQKSVIKGDEKVFSCAAASILAKVTRDRIMVRLSRKYPKYKFEIHKGYPTKLHLRLLKKHGPCKIHRRSFAPVASCKVK